MNLDSRTDAPADADDPRFAGRLDSHESACLDCDGDALDLWLVDGRLRAVNAVCPDCGRVHSVAETQEFDGGVEA